MIAQILSPLFMYNSRLQTHILPSERKWKPTSSLQQQVCIFFSDSLLSTATIIKSFLSFLGNIDDLNSGRWISQLKWYSSLRLLFVYVSYSEVAVVPRQPLDQADIYSFQGLKGSNYKKNKRHVLTLMFMA